MVFEIVVKRALEQGARLSYGHRWLVVNLASNEYEIFGQEYHQRVKKLFATVSIDEAVQFLMKKGGEN